MYQAVIRAFCTVVIGQHRYMTPGFRKHVRSACLTGKWSAQRFATVYNQSIDGLEELSIRLAGTCKAELSGEDVQNALVVSVEFERALRLQRPLVLPCVGSFRETWATRMRETVNFYEQNGCVLWTFCMQCYRSSRSCVLSTESSFKSVVSETQSGSVSVMRLELQRITARQHGTLNVSYSSVLSRRPGQCSAASCRYCNRVTRKSRVIVLPNIRTPDLCTCTIIRLL